MTTAHIFQAAISPVLRRLVAVTVWGLLAAGSAMSAGDGRPSFDCAKASSASEKAVCASPALSALDSKMAEVYREARTASNDPDRVKADQLAWIKASRACNADAACLERAYNARLNELMPPPVPAAAAPALAPASDASAAASAPAAEPAEPVASVPAATPAVAPAPAVEASALPEWVFPALKYVGLAVGVLIGLALLALVGLKLSRAMKTGAAQAAEQGAKLRADLAEKAERAKVLMAEKTAEVAEMTAHVAEDLSAKSKEAAALASARLQEGAGQVEWKTALTTDLPGKVLAIAVGGCFALLAIVAAFRGMSILMTAGFAALSLGNFLYLNQFGARKYREALAVSLLVTLVVSAGMFDYTLGATFNFSLLGKVWFWLVVAVFTVLTFLLATVFTYFLFFMGFLSLFSLLLIMLGLKGGPILGLMVIGASGALTYYLRREIKWLTIGLIAGMSLAATLLIAFWELTGDFAQNHILGLTSFCYLLGIAAGIYLQFVRAKARPLAGPDNPGL